MSYIGASTSTHGKESAGPHRAAAGRSQTYSAILREAGKEVQVRGIVSGDLDPRDPTAAKGFGNMSAELKQTASKGGTVYVFGLPK